MTEAERRERYAALAALSKSAAIDLAMATAYEAAAEVCDSARRAIGDPECPIWGSDDQRVADALMRCAAVMRARARL